MSHKQVELATTNVDSHLIDMNNHTSSTHNNDTHHESTSAHKGYIGLSRDGPVLDGNNNNNRHHHHSNNNNNDHVNNNDTTIDPTKPQQQRMQSDRQINGTKTISGRTIPRTSSRMETFINPDTPFLSRIHRCPLNTLVKEVHTNTLNGLTTEQCTIGLNQITEHKPSFIIKFLGYLFGGFNSVMWIAMILSILAYQPLGGKNPQILAIGVAVVLALVILMSTLFYFKVDYSANQMMEAMKGMVANDCLVIRNGVETIIDANNVSIGDIVCLSLGQRVPADLRLIEVSNDLAFDRSLLTGEADPIQGTTQCTDKNILETKNIALSSSFVLRGTAKGIAYAIGDDTVIGQIVKLASKPKQVKTPIQKEILRFTIIVSTVAFSSFITAIILWAAWQKIKYPGFNTAGSAIINAIGFLCALVPQGLPVAFALSLTIVAKKMSQCNVLVKNLSTIETLGCMSLICSDKTGTLTSGKMTVQECLSLDNRVDIAAAARIAITNSPQQPIVAIDDDLLPGVSAERQSQLLSMSSRVSSHSNRSQSTHSQVESSGADSIMNRDRQGTNNASSFHKIRGSSHHASNYRGFQESAGLAFSQSPSPINYAIHRISSLCCNAVFLPQLGADEIPIEQRLINGDPTDTAVLRFSHASRPYLGITTDELEYSNQYITLYTLPFNSNNKFMATVVIEKNNPSAKPLILIKGGPDVLLPKCSTCFTTKNVPQQSQQQQLQTKKHHRKPSETSLALPDLTPPPTTTTFDTDLYNTPTEIITNALTTCTLDEVVLTTLNTMKNDASKNGLRVIALAQYEIDDLQLIPSSAIDDYHEEDYNDENNLSDIDEEEEQEHTQNPPQADSTPTIPKPQIAKAKYIYPQNWEQYILTTLAKKQCTIAGFLSIMDPPRPDVPDTVAALATAGVTTTMVTGDYEITAAAIARKVNIITCPSQNVANFNDLSKLQSQYLENHSIPTIKDQMKPIKELNPDKRHALVLNGSQIPQLTESNWDFMCTYFHEFVFARTTPEHKQTIVENFKERGRVTCLSFDGTNDVAAAKSSDIGVCMGSGADLAKDAASLILLDNSFSSVLTGLIYGRLVFANLRKIVMYLMSCGALVEFLAVVVNVCLGTPLPLNSFLQVVFCSLNDIVMSISLMLEQPEGNILEQAPRDVKKDRLVDARWLFHLIFQFALVSFIASIGMWFLALSDYGIGFSDVVLSFNKWTEGYKGFTKKELDHISNRASSAYYASMVLCNFGNLLAIRTRYTSIFRSNPFWGPNKNIAIPICMFISICIAFFVLYIPGLGSVVGTTRISYKLWLIPCTFPFFIVGLDELRKLLVRRFPNGPVAYIAW